MTCDHADSSVKDSRPASIYGGATVRRRRVCNACGERFSTYELSLEQMIDLKSDAIRERLSQAIVRSLGGEIKSIIERCVGEMIEEDRRLNQKFHRK